MLHHASRLVNSSGTIHNASPFSGILQAAAGRAWVRRAYTTRNTTIKSEPRKASERTANTSYVPLDASKNDTNRHDIYSIPAHRENGCNDTAATVPTPTSSRISFRAHMAAKQTQVNKKTTNWSHSRRKPGKHKQVGVSVVERPTEDDAGPIAGSPVPQLEKPTDSTSLYRNLLTLVYNKQRPTPLPDLIQYYHHNSRDYHSTRSYNFLISLAIRHACLGTAHELIKTMRVEGFKGDLETWKLKVRLLIRCGQWGGAWRSVLADVKNPERMCDIGLSPKLGAGMPLVIWIEFFMTMKLGSIRQWTGKDGGLQILRENLRNGEDSGASVDVQRLRVLMEHAPTLTPDQYTAMPARAVYFIVWAMLRIDHPDDARNMTRSYLTGLPAKLDDTHIRASLDIIHLHISFGIKELDALAAHRCARQLVEEFLSMHDDLRPSARTLFLLLRPLKRSLYAGTHARRAVNAFCNKWGDFLRESPNVRRRVTEFAVKQGNSRQAEHELSRGHHPFAKKKSPKAKVPDSDVAHANQEPSRKPFTHVHQGSGVEAYKWWRLRRGVKKLKSKKAEAAEKAVKVLVTTGSEH